MDTAPPKYNATPAPHPLPEPAQDAARTDRNLHILDEMIEVGVELVRRTRATLEVTASQEAGFAQAERCARLVRAVERAIALSAWIIKDRRLAAAHHQHQQSEATDARRAERRKHLNHLMGKAIDAAPPEKAPRLLRRYQLRMHDWDIEHDLTHHSVEAAITRLCTELGIAPPSPYAAPGATPSQPAAQPAPACHATIPLRPLSAAATAQMERALAMHGPPTGRS